MGRIARRRHRVKVRIGLADGAVLAVGLGAVAWLWLGVLTPQNASYDARWYHLSIAQHYVAEGRISAFSEGWVPGAVPQLASLLWTWALCMPGSLFDRVVTAAHVELAVFLFTLVGIPALVRRVLGRRVPGAWVALFLFPGIFCYDSGLVLGADHIAAVFAAPILLLSLRHWQRASRPIALLLAAVTAGAVCTKYTALNLVPVPLAVVAVRAFLDRTLAPATTFAAGVLAFSSPHWLKNVLFYGDPVFPVLRNWLPAHPWTIAAEAPHRTWFTLAHPRLGVAGIVDMLKTLVAFSFVPHDFPQYHGEVPVFGSLFTLTTPFLLVLRRHRVTLVFGAAYACAQDRVDNPGVAACTDQLVRYAPAWVRQHAVGTYGFDQENADYFARVVSDGPQGMMVPPAALLAAMPTQAAIVATAREQGWPYLVHDSGLGGVRTLIAITDPAGRFEQWMVLGVTEGDVLTGPSIMSFLAVQLTHVNGAALSRPRVYFRDFVLSPGPTGWSAALPPEFDGKCYACHGTGPRALIPLHGSIVSSAPVNGEPGYGTPAPAGFGFTRLQSLNARLLAYGPPDWNGTLDPADHGPPLGAKLGCPSCHNGVVRGPVTVSTSEGMLAEKVLHQLSMRASMHGEAVPDEGAIALLDRESTKSPPLTDGEKAGLAQAKAAHLADYQALIADRFPSWQAWILETPCK